MCPPRPAHHAHPPGPAVVDTKLASGVIVPTAPWLIAENAKPGTLDWICNFVQPDHALEGFASQVSAVPGDDVALFVNTTAQRRAGPGLPDGLLPGPGRPAGLAERHGRGRPQPPPVVTPGTGTVTCPWSPTTTISITKDWPPGCYLLKLVGNGGQEQFVPLTVRDDASTAAYVLQNSVTTWQAYNLYGDYSLYYGPTARAARTSPTAPAPSPSTAPTPRPGPRARPTSSATSSPCSSTSRASGST